jgi:hypothetical protein
MRCLPCLQQPRANAGHRQVNISQSRTWDGPVENVAVSLGTGVAVAESEGSGVLAPDLSLSLSSTPRAASGSGVGAGDGLPEAGVLGRESWGGAGHSFIGHRHGNASEGARAPGRRNAQRDIKGFEAAIGPARAIDDDGMQ